MATISRIQQSFIFGKVLFDLFFKIIRFKIIIYLLIKQNLLNLAAKMEFIKIEHFVGKSPVYFLVYKNKLRHPRLVKF